MKQQIVEFDNVKQIGIGCQCGTEIVIPATTRENHPHACPTCGTTLAEQKRQVLYVYDLLRVVLQAVHPVKLRLYVDVV